MDGNQVGFFAADAFKCIFDTYKKRVYAYVLAVSHSPYAAEELTQEIFLKLWLCRDLLGAVENMDAYIFTIARHKTLNYLRKASYDSRLLKELQARMEPASNDVEEYSLLKDCESMTAEAVTLLSPQRRLVYQLSRNQGMNHEEIAGQLQISRNTVKNHLVEALRFIRGYLASF